MDQMDFSPDDCVTLYHELSHAAQITGGISLGGMMNEGFAVYTANKVLLNQNLPIWDTAVYFFPASFDESLIAGGENTFKCDYSILGDFEVETNYQYGFRFVMFLYKTYGENIFNDIIAEAEKQDYYDGYDTDIEASVKEKSQQLLSIIKTVTSDDVLTEFNQWYDRNWESLGQRYIAHMEELTA